MRRLSLDDATPDGRSVHELIADPRTIDPPDEPARDEPIGSEAGPDGLASLDAARRISDLERQATAAESEALDLLRKANDLRRAAELLRANVLLDAQHVESLGALSPQQFAIARARVALAVEGEHASHHAVGRRLGLHPAAVSRQWSRVRAKFAANLGREVYTRIQVSTPLPIGRSLPMPDSPLDRPITAATVTDALDRRDLVTFLQLVDRDPETTLNAFVAWMNTPLAKAAR